jgi:hypothetical protein
LVERLVWVQKAAGSNPVTLIFFRSIVGGEIVMTLSIVWVRTAGDSQELLLATDSRLRFGCKWDSCQKIFILPRDDCAICFAGDTQYAYPLMHAMESAIRYFPKSLNRQQELSDLKGHALRVFNSMLRDIGDLPVGQAEPDTPEAFFLFGGFCWKRKAFALWTLHFDASIRAFTFRPTSPWDGVDGHKQIAFVGDYVEDARKLLITKLKAKGRLEVGGFDMEPFEVLRDLLREKSGRDYIGGAPQLAKVYQRCASVAFPVMWNGVPHLLGRSCLSGEGVYSAVFDPDKLEFRACRPKGSGFEFVGA